MTHAFDELHYSGGDSGGQFYVTNMDPKCVDHLRRHLCLCASRLHRPKDL